MGRLSVAPEQFLLNGWLFLKCRYLRVIRETDAAITDLGVALEAERARDLVAGTGLFDFQDVGDEMFLRLADFVGLIIARPQGAFAPAAPDGISLVGARQCCGWTG